MIIAEKLKRENIAEYILYMWQVEDIIRSNNFDLTQISDLVITKFEGSEEGHYKMKFWYQNLIEEMMKEGITDKGHLKLTLKLIEELNNLHNSLLTTLQDKLYQEQYLKAKDHLNKFRLKTGADSQGEVYSCFIGLYGLFLLRLKQAEISDSTKESMSTFSGLLAILTDRYHKLLNGELKLPVEKSN